VISEAHSKTSTAEDAKQVQAIKKCILENDKLARSVNELLRQKEEIEN